MCPDGTASEGWLGRQDSNLRMPVPKTGALPLGDAPAVSPHLRESGAYTGEAAGWKGRWAAAGSAL